MTTETPFLIFWRVQNRLRQLDGLPEWLYGEAHDEWMARRSAAALHQFHLRMARAGRRKADQDADDLRDKDRANLSEGW